MRLNPRLFASLLLATACRSSTEPFADVHVVTSVSARGIAGVSIAINTTIVNGSNRAFTFDSGACPRRFRVETSGGLTVALREQVCDLLSRPLTLAPGERYQFDESWDSKDASGMQRIGAFRVVGQPFLNSGPQSEPVTVQLLQ